MLRIKGWRLIVLCAATVLVSASADAGRRFTRASGERGPGAVCSADSGAKLHDQFVAQGNAPGVESSLRVELNPQEIQALSSPSHERRIRVGTARRLGAHVRFHGLRARDLASQSIRLPHGVLRGLGTGGFVWTEVVESPGAAALRLRFTGFFLPRNAALFVYNDLGEVFGPYTGRGPHGDGEFWSHTLRGSKISLQLRYQGRDTDRALRASGFVIADVGHLTPDFPLALFGPPHEDERAATGFCSFNASCVSNASCASLPPAIENARDAVALVQFESGGFLYICSGGLVADTDPGSAIPYFITANHCVSKKREARSLEAFFQFVTSCGGSCQLDGSVPRTLGASLVSTSRSSDYTLLRLSESAPLGSWFLGWNSEEVAHSHGATLFRISHPRGAPQASSEHSVDTSKPTCSSWPRGSWIYSRDVSGAVEGGSSGSPLLDADGELVGQLTGACGYDVHNVCNAQDNATVDGAFAAYFAEVEPFLDPTNSCTDADNDGSCAEEGDCDDANPAVHPGASEICDDSLDNDCDNLVDGEDPSCQTQSCDLGAKHEPCSADAECCSGKCRGRLGRRSCR